MVCLAGNNMTEITTFIRESGSNQRVKSGEDMKILGFHFNCKPSPDFHIDCMTKRIKKRMWLLRNLKSAKATKKDVTDSYCCFIRPVLDYCACVYHPMLTKQASNQLEKLQYSALRIIFVLGNAFFNRQNNQRNMPATPFPE